MKEENIAILSRVSFYLKNFEDSLKREGISFNVQGKSRFYLKGIVRALINYLESVYTGKKTPFKNSLKFFLGEKALKKLPEDILLLWKEHQKRYPVKTPREVIDEYMEKIGFFELIKSLPPDQEKEEREIIEEFYYILSPYKQGEIKKFLDSFAILENLETDRKEGGVFVSTIHGAKGLEFEIVFITGLSESLFPRKGSLSSRKELDEERRLFYVALTRSFGKVFLTRPKTRMGRKLLPSRFLEEMIIS